MNYKLILTEYGIEMVQKAISTNTLFDAAYIGIGDANGNSYEPDKTQVELKNRTYLGDIYEKDIKRLSNNKYLYFDMQIPADIGGFTIREVGLYDSNYKLLAVAKYPETYKEVVSGTTEEILLIELQLLISDEAINNIIIDASGNLATVEKVEQNFQKLSEKGQPDGYASLDAEGKVPETQLPEMVSGMPVFCFNSGRVDEKGEAALLSLEGDILTQHAPAVCTTAEGKTYNVIEDVTLDISALADGKYNIFYDPTANTLQALANNVFIQKSKPELAEGDIWVDTSVKPYVCKKLDGSALKVIQLVWNAVIDRVSGGGKMTIRVYNSSEITSQAGVSLPLLAPVILDRILSYKDKESKYLAMQGTYIYKTGVAGERHGYPCTVQQLIDEKKAGTPEQVTLGGSTITMYKNPNGHQLYDIADKAVIDEWFNTYGMADFYGVDEANERIFLPRSLHGTVIERFTDGTNGYRVWSDGFCEQWGRFVNPQLTYTFLKPFRDKNYTVTYMQAGGESANIGRIALKTFNTTSFVIEGMAQTVLPACWRACGYLAENQYNASLRLLYYVVGNTSEITHVTTTIPETEVLSQVNKNTTDILNKVNLDGSNAKFPYITETYQNGASWYRIYSDGWCEQGGTFNSPTLDYTLKLLKSFNNTNYYINATMNHYDASLAGTTIQYVTRMVGVISSKTKSSVLIQCHNAVNYNWFACGYIG